MTPLYATTCALLLMLGILVGAGFGIIAGTALERRRHPAPRKTAADMIGAAGRRRVSEDQARRVGA